MKTEAKHNEGKSRAGEVDPPIPPPGNVLCECSSEKRSDATGKTPDYSCKSEVESSISE